MHVVWNFGHCVEGD